MKKVSFLPIRSILILTDELFSWGRGDHGQLGHGTTLDEFTPKKVLIGMLSHAHSVKVACGGHHTIVALGEKKQQHNCLQMLEGNVVCMVLAEIFMVHH